MGRRDGSRPANEQGTSGWEKAVCHLEEIRSLLSQLVGQENSTYVWDFSNEVTADAGNSVETDEVRLEIPYDGKITEIILGWSQGANQAVGVQFRSAEGERYIPRNDDNDVAFIGMDNHVLPPIPLNVDVSEGDEFIAEFRNNDPDNSHFVNVEAYVREE